MKRLLYSLIPAVLIFLPNAIGAQELFSLEDIRNLALNNSLEYKKAQLEAELAAGNVDSLVDLENTLFSAGQNYNSESEQWTSSASVELPLLDQLSLNGTLKNDNTLQGGVQFSPLSHNDDRKQQKIALQKARALVRETALNVENTALSCALNWMVQTRLLKNQDEIVSVKESIYSDQKVRYQAGEASLDDMREVLLDWTDVRSSLGSLQSQVRQAESELIETFGVSPDSLELPLLKRESLENELNLIKLSLVPEKAESAGAYEILSSLLDVQSSQIELADTWLFDPDLSMNTAVELNDGETGWEVSLSFSFSPSDWHSSQRKDLQSELELLEQEARQTALQEHLSLQQALTALDTTARGTEMARIEREQAKELYEEARFLYELGDYSQAEMDDAYLAYDASEISLFRALADEYLAWRDLLVYMPEG